jgi:hypothetical protein
MGWISLSGYALTPGETRRQAKGQAPPKQEGFQVW